MGSSGDLSPLQRATLRAFFDRERGFFLTGGAALAGFHLHHRTTDDLDLFTADRTAFERGRHVMTACADALRASLAIRQDAPGFKRFVVTQNQEMLVVDLVLDETPSTGIEKLVVEGIVVDPPEEILANKLTAIVGRTEERDLVDLMMLEASGLRVEDALPFALAKDGGCTPANLAWLLAQMTIPDEASLPGGVSPQTLRSYVVALVDRLAILAAP